MLLLLRLGFASIVMVMISTNPYHGNHCWLTIVTIVMVMIIATIVTIIIGFASIVMVMISTNTYNYNDYHGNHCHGNDDNLNLF